jgi:hypothetical protein
MEISGFSDTKDWFHITTEKNVADLGTRPALLAKIGRDPNIVMYVKGTGVKF